MLGFVSDLFVSFTIYVLIYCGIKLQAQVVGTIIIHHRNKVIYNKACFAIQIFLFYFVVAAIEHPSLISNLSRFLPRKYLYKLLFSMLVLLSLSLSLSLSNSLPHSLYLSGKIFTFSPSLRLKVQVSLFYDYLVI